MKKFVILTTAVLSSLTLSRASFAQNCADGQKLNVALGVCAQVADHSAVWDVRGAPPDRATRHMPPPAGEGGGVEYTLGQLHVGASSDLQTYMSVHPGGIATGLTNFVFNTATNRTDRTLEILAAYDNNTADIDVYDWSCSKADPCQSIHINPSFVYVGHMSDLQACYLQQHLDSGNHLRWEMYYSNSQTYSLVSHRWTNNAYFWNYCTNSWDIIYAHSFGGTQRDCSTVYHVCGWWGPILETDLTGVQYHEFGFRASTLTVDGTVHQLDSTVTTWATLIAPSTIFHRTPNYSWGAGYDTNE